MHERGIYRRGQLAARQQHRLGINVIKMPQILTYLVVRTENTWPGIVRSNPLPSQDLRILPAVTERTSREPTSARSATTGQSGSGGHLGSALDDLDRSFNNEGRERRERRGLLWDS